MANQNEDFVVEQHILEVISHAIESSGKEKNQLEATKHYSFESDFRRLVEALKVETRPAVEDWLSVRRANVYRLRNLLTKWENFKNQSSLTKEVLGSYRSLSESLKEMKKEVLARGKESSSGGDHRPDGSRQESHHPTFEIHKSKVYRWSSRHGPRNVHGFDHLVRTMERDLVMFNIQALGVAGDAGIGKTTLCQSVFAQKSVKESFSPRIWVCLSTQPKQEQDYRKEIVIRILKCLGVEDEDISDAANSDDGLRRLILLLRLQLIGRRYLIILDDAWKDHEFFYKLTQKEQLVEEWGEELANGLPKGCGGAIISSSRSKALLRNMLGKDASLQHLEPQTDDIIKKIFKETVIGYDKDNSFWSLKYGQHLEELEKEIVRNCDGIPLAAKLLAKIAREELQDEKSASDGDGYKSKQAAGGVKYQIGSGAGDEGVQDGEHRGR